MRKGKRTSIYTAPNWDIFSCMYSHPCSLNGDQQTSFERNVCDSTAIYIQSVVPGHWAHWKTSLKEILTVWAQGAGKKNRRCIVSKPSVLVLWKKSTEQRMLLSKPTDLYDKEKTSLPVCLSLTPLPCRLLAENEADESLAHNDKTQQQPLQPVLLSVCADCHTHPCLWNEAAAAQSHTHYITFNPRDC